MFLDFVVVHFVSASLAAIVVAVGDGFSTHDTGREVAATRSAESVILTHEVFAGSSRTLDPLARCFFGRVFGEDTHSDVSVPFSLFCSAHSFKFDEGSRTFFITLHPR